MRGSILCAIVLPLAACGRPAPAPEPTPTSAPPVTSRSAWREVEEGALNAEQGQQRRRALAARDTLATRLLERLTQETKASGPVRALEVCRMEAQVILGAVAEAERLKIGRTSHRLRNPSNLPPPWAQAYVAEVRERPVTVVSDDGRLGVLEPIRLKAACLACHGDPAQMEPAVREALLRAYPADRATGFRENDLRGWFWVEVP